MPDTHKRMSFRCPVELVEAMDLRASMTGETLTQIILDCISVGMDPQIAAQVAEMRAKEAWYVR